MTRNTSKVLFIFILLNSFVIHGVYANQGERYNRELALEQVDGGVLENFSISSLSMTAINGYPIYITLGDRNCDPYTTGIPAGKNIMISNVVATMVDSLSRIHITGTANQKLEDVRISNVKFTSNAGGAKELANNDFPELGKGYPELYMLDSATPFYGVYARHVKNLGLDNINVGYNNEDKRPAIICIDVDGLEIDKFKAEITKGTSPAVFQAVKNFKIYNSPVLEDMGGN